MSSTNENSNNILIVDHSKAQKARCFLSQQKELGNKGDCPLRTRVSWKWVGETDAAFKSCWDVESQMQPVEVSNTQHSINFSCGVTLEGQDVFQGIQSLIAMGYVRTPLPDFIRDSPAIGSNIIEVNHGKLVMSSKP